MRWSSTKSRFLLTTLKDEDGDYPDWIEIHNTTNQTIDLSNYALSDSTDKLVKWRFPQGSTIAPNGYFVVFASKKDRAAAEGSWPHANFKLRSNGETVILSDIQGRMVDMVTYDLLSADTSWGRDEEGDGSFKVFTSAYAGSSQYPRRHDRDGHRALPRQHLRSVYHRGYDRQQKHTWT